MKTHNCPICRIELDVNERYPNYVCPECAENVTDENGRELMFNNLDLSGGFQGQYQDTKEPYEGHDCYIKNIKCYAGEARFGGIVVQVV